MNREILFRGKRIDNGEQVEGYYLQIGLKSFIICHAEADYMDGKNIDLYATEWCEVDPSTVCQFTGLTDKNGKKIWENDIVEFLGHIGIIQYENGCFGIGFRDTIDWGEVENNICPVTGCDNALYACENDNFISLWEIVWNFNEEDCSVNMVEVIGNIYDNPELLEVDNND